jgi:L-aspartate oxidase
MIPNHPSAELAPRDIVARGIFKEMLSSNKEYVFLDITSKPEDYLRERFPTIFNECLKHGINIAHDKIPVHPVQHYLMGGILTDLEGRTNINGLYACGEAASTGIHGANRLAANSLLECLVFGRRTARSINSNTVKSKKITPSSTQELFSGILVKPREHVDYTKLRAKIQHLMSEHCGIIRKKSGILFALEQVSSIYTELDAIFDESVEYLEALNIATLAKEILEAASRRPVSVGSHYIVEED